MPFQCIKIFFFMKLYIIITITKQDFRIKNSLKLSKSG